MLIAPDLDLKLMFNNLIKAMQIHYQQEYPEKMMCNSMQLDTFQFSTLPDMFALICLYLILMVPLIGI